MNKTIDKVTTKRMALYSGRTHPVLAQEVAAHLEVQLGDANIVEFANGELRPRFGESVRGGDVFIMQTHCSTEGRSINDSIMEQLIMIDAAYRASAKRVTAVCPFYGYARQDRKSGPRTPISAKLLANLITSAGADRVLTIDLHAGQIQGFFDIPTDNLFAAPVFVSDIKERYDGSKLMIVSPDVGGVVRARSLARRLEADLAIIDKRRPKAGVSEVMNIIGDVEDRHCIMVDDIVDSGGTLCNAAIALMKAGALSVDAYVTHGVLSGGAVSRVAASPLNSLVTTDSIPATEAVRVARNIRQLSIAPLLGEAMLRINEERSVSTLF